jgi:hypothetical protein
VARAIPAAGVRIIGEPLAILIPGPVPSVQPCAPSAHTRDATPIAAEYRAGAEAGLALMGLFLRDASFVRVPSARSRGANHVGREDRSG